MMKSTILTLLLSAITSLPTIADTIDRIVVSGNNRTDASSVIAQSGLKTKEEYSEEIASRALEQLYESEAFEKVDVSFSNGVAKIAVLENPIISQIHITGASGISEEAVLSEMTLKPRQAFSKARLRQDVNRILSLYSRSGRMFAVVRPKMERLPQNRINLLIEISENKKAKIKKITFVGNSNFSDGMLKSVLTSKEARIYNMMRMTHYDADVVEYDKTVLTRFYQDHGFADFKVRSATAILLPNDNAFAVNFAIEEGERFRFGDISITSSVNNLDQISLKKLLTIKAGTLFNATAVDKSTEILIQHLAMKGFPFVSVDPQYVLDHKTKRVHVQYRMTTGIKAYIGRIIISGNLRTYDRIIRRELRLAEGDPYNAFLLNRSEQRIRNLNYFEKVQIELERTNKADVVDVHVKVEEKSTAGVNLNIGYSTLDGIGGAIGFTESNFLGKGQTLGLRLSRSAGSLSAGFGFAEPNFLDSQFDAGFDFDFLKEFEPKKLGGSPNTVPYKRTIHSGSVYARYDITDKVSNLVTYSLSSERTRALRQNCPAIVIGQSGKKNIVSSIGYRLTYDGVDNRVRPTTGWLSSLSQTFSGLGGTSRYLSNVVDIKYFKPISKDIVLKIAGEAGHIRGIGGRHIRVSDNFNLGDLSFRGFEFAGIGPRDRQYPTSSLGGTTYYKGTVEATLPIPGVPKDIDMLLAIFADFGTLRSLEIQPDIKYSRSDYNDSSCIRASVGTGIVWVSPLGPIRIYFAKAVSKAPFDITQNFHIAMSTFL